MQLFGVKIEVNIKHNVNWVVANFPWYIWASGIILPINTGKLIDNPETEFNATDTTPSPFTNIRSIKN